MAYGRTTNLIARPTVVNRGMSRGMGIESDLGGFLDDITSFGKNVLTAYGEQKKAEGAAGAMVSTPSGTVIPGITPAPSSGPSMGTILLIGGLGVGAILLLKKKGKR